MGKSRLAELTRPTGLPQTTVERPTASWAAPTEGRLQDPFQPNHAVILQFPVEKLPPKGSVLGKLPQPAHPNAHTHTHIWELGAAQDFSSVLLPV